MVIINRIKELRKAQKLNMREVAKKLNIPYTTYVNYEKGVREPNSEMLILIANYFNVSVDYLIGRDDKNFPTPNITNDYTTFPIIGEIAAGFDHIANEDWDGEVIDIPNSHLKGRPKQDFFVLRVKGDSMYPVYQENDKVLILKQPTLDYSGQVGAVLYDNEYASLKKIEYVPGEDWMRLIPINPNVPPETISGERLEYCKILGVAVLLIRDIYNFQVR